ncbi:hypothetical protein SAMN06297251_10429 [Fulvimarina manganoxydans]|uniref:Uncharacterized protein n=1 Tax=Fulvimarina manganoxydans TaxID=937218 RepID=A0A1W2A891_9HYPH|nr:hypothetical protein [Fulvimarina manganoxydans]SMC56949.1 hypothetical protein SAMN06297251_10429 [Fulvimarina manganoxydans]
MRLNVAEPCPADYPERALGRPILDRFLDDENGDEDIAELIRVAGLGDRRRRWVGDDDN